MSDAVKFAVIGIGQTGISRAFRLAERLLEPATLIFIDQDDAPERMLETSICRNVRIPRDFDSDTSSGALARNRLIEELEGSIGKQTPLVFLASLNSAISRAVLRQLLENLRNTILWSETNYSPHIVPKVRADEARALLQELQERSMGSLVRNFEEAHAGLYAWMDADMSPLHLAQNLWEVAAHSVDDYMGALIRRSANLERTKM